MAPQPGTIRVEGEFGITEIAPGFDVRPERDFAAERKRDPITYPDVIREYFNGNVEAFEAAKPLGLPTPLRGAFTEHAGVFGIWGRRREAIYSRTAIEAWRTRFQTVAAAMK